MAAFNRDAATAGRRNFWQPALYAGNVWSMMASVLTRIVYICLVFSFSCLTFLAGRASDFNTDTAETAGIMRTWHMADNGLPSDSVTAIIQTRDSFLWIGTTAGLVRFDGVRFTAIKPDRPLANSLTGITALCEDSGGHLWIGTQQNGLFQLTGGKTLHYGREQGLLNDNVTSLAADNAGQVWIGGSAGLSLWTGREFISFTKADGLPDDSVSGVNVARSGAVWITTRVGMCRFINGHITPYEFQTESQGRRPEYLGAYEDRHGNLWAFGDTYLINLAEGKRFNYFRSSESPSVRIWSLCEGLNGRLWIGTSGRGLFCFEDNRFQPVILGDDRWPYHLRRPGRRSLAGHIGRRPGATAAAVGACFAGGTGFAGKSANHARAGCRWPPLRGPATWRSMGGRIGKV